MMTDDLKAWLRDRDRVRAEVERRQNLHMADPDQFKMPTMREVAKKLRLSIKRVAELCEDIDHMCVNTGIGIPGAGYANIERQGDYEPELLV
jgi:hypothetical protein